jgi:hypothetical protein
MSLDIAFSAILSLQQRDMTLSRPGGSTVTIKVAPSNFFRSLEAVAEISVPGHEFVISKNELTRVAWGALKKGDKIANSDIGTVTIDTIDPMYGLHAAVLGYRVRTA